MGKLLGVLISVLVTLSASAKTSVNSVCYLQNSTKAQIQGNNTDQLFEIASVSKVFVTQWAIHQLGVNFRFNTVVHVTPIADGQADVHLQGSLDPFFGRQLTHFLISELNRLGVKQVRNLTFDENFKLRWAVLTAFENPMNPPPEEIAAGLSQHMRVLAKEYPQTFQEALKLGVVMTPASGVKVSSVSYLPKASFVKASNTVSYVLRSAPLYKYLKQMNVVSNNHVADKLYDYLGGASKFQEFFQQTLQLDGSHLNFVNGSGNSVVVGEDGAGRPIKQYNKATCDSLIRVLLALQNELQSRQGMDITQILAVAKADLGTLSPRYDGVPNSMVAKTGTVDPAVTMAGILSTGQGNVYFGMLMKTDGVADWENARERIRGYVFDLMARHGGAQPFPYNPAAFLPFDSYSAFAPLGARK